MTRMMMTMAALGALAAASPAAAQWAGGNADIQGLRAEIDAGVSRGDIASQDAYALRSQLRGLIDLQQRYASDGLSRSERNDLQQRAQGLRNEIADAEGSASGYGRGDRYNEGSDSDRPYGNAYNNGYGASGGGQYRTQNNDRFGTYGNGTYNSGTYNSGTYNSGNGAYPNRTYNDGASSNGYGSGRYSSSGSGQYGSQYGRDDGYARDQSRYDRDDGSDRDDDGGYVLRVGDRAAGDLYAVPDAYRGRFRDGGNVYYRYGAGNVYQIDVRNGVVLRVIPVGR
ncbi:MAG: hypothetical protein JWO81_618 [Alphaproteobacteria bacterium]|nr:hypothetical protein [Alphaproteobacteria bacterium]